jgi:hypothetical protein
MSTTRRVEQASDGCVIEWREHAFSDVMRSCNRPALTLEPRLLAAEQAGDVCLRVTPSERGITWPWDDWSVVGVRFASTSHMVQAIQRADGASHGQLAWSHLTDQGTDEVELTPWRVNGPNRVPGAVRCVVAPPSVPRRRVLFETASRGTISVTAQNGLPKAATLVALSLHATNNTLVPVREAACGDMRGSIGVSARFGGIVALVEGHGSARRLVAACQVWLGECRGVPGGDEWKRVYAALRLAPGARHWPARTRDRLLALHHLAASRLSSGDACVAVDRQLTALMRWLVLRELGAVLPWTSGVWLALAKGDFNQAVDAAVPDARVLMQRVGRPEQKQWVFTNRALPTLSAAIEWAPTATPEGLALAAQWCELRKRIGDALDQVTPESDLASELTALKKRIDQSPITLDPPDRQPVQALLDLIDRELKSVWHDLDGTEPLTKVAAKRWNEKRQARQAWRTNAGQVVSYCRTGSWHTTAIDPDGLAADAAAVTDLDHLVVDGVSGDDVERLQAAAGSVVDQAGAETNTLVRQAVVSAIHAHVAGKERLWCRLWRAVADAPARIEQYPGLARLFDLDAGWNELSPLKRFQRAELFAQASTALETVVAGCRNRELTTILQLVDDEWLPRRGSEAAGALSRLEGRHEAGGPTHVVDRPAAATVEACQAWWQQVIRFDHELQRLLSAEHDLNVIAGWVQPRARRRLTPSSDPRVITLCDPDRKLTFRELQQLCHLWGEAA